MNCLTLLFCLAFASTVYADGCTKDYCQNEGVCYDFGDGPRCNCKDFFGGDRCEIDPCNPSPCVQGHGFCIKVDWGQKECICRRGYSGEFCENIDAAEGNGGIQADGCTRDYCKHGGVCYDFGQGPQCNCRDFFGGDRCEIDPCTPSPCVQGFCYRKTWGIAGCFCFSGFSGEHCEIAS